MSPSLSFLGSGLSKSRKVFDMSSTAVRTVEQAKVSRGTLLNFACLISSANADSMIVRSRFWMSWRKMSWLRLNFLRNMSQRFHERDCWFCVFPVVALLLAMSAELRRDMRLFLAEAGISLNHEVSD